MCVCVGGGGGIHFAHSKGLRCLKSWEFSKNTSDIFASLVMPNACCTPEFSPEKASKFFFHP